MREKEKKVRFSFRLDSWLCSAYFQTKEHANQLLCPIRYHYRMMTDIIYACGCVYLEAFNQSRCVNTYVFDLLKSGRFMCRKMHDSENYSGGNFFNNTTLLDYRLNNQKLIGVEKTSLSLSTFFLRVLYLKNLKTVQCAPHNSFKFRNDWKCFISWTIHVRFFSLTPSHLIFLIWIFWRVLSFFSRFFFSLLCDSLTKWIIAVK